MNAPTLPPSGVDQSPGTTARRHEIVDMAMRMFVTKGFHATTVRDLANAAGITLPTLYYYIGSKMDVLAVAHNEVADALLRLSEAIAAGDESSDVKLKNFIEAQISVIHERRDQVVVFAREIHSLTPEVSAELQPKRDRIQQIFDEIIREGVASGMFRNIKLMAVRFFVFGMITSYAASPRSQGTSSAHDVASDFAELLLQGLTTR